MTRQDFILKWLFYALSLLPVWWLDVFVLNRFTVLGVSPRLLPVAAITVAVLEGTVGGAGFGLAVGLHSGYGSAQRMYVKRGYVPDGTGAWYRGAQLAQYAPCVNDDDLVLHMQKRLNP